MKLGAIGDLHLGCGVARFGPERLVDQEQVLVRAFETFREEGCDAVLVPGDIWHGPSVPPEQYVVFARALRVLDGIPVVAINGNGVHDLAMRDTNALRVFEATYNPAALSIRCEPDIVDLGHVSIACLPWASVKNIVARNGGGDRDDANAYAAELLVQVAEDMRDQINGQPAVLLTHFSVSGAALPNGLPVDQLREPVLDVAALQEIGFDAIVVGHIHAAQHALRDGSWCRIVYSDGSEPTTRHGVFYTGSPLPHDFGETETAHGAWIVDLGDEGTEARFFPLPSRQLLTLDAEWLGDVPCWPYEDDKIDGAIVRARYQATEEQARRIDHAQLRRDLFAFGAHRVFIQPEIVRAERSRVADLDETVDEYAAFELWLDSVGKEANPIGAPEVRDRLIARHREYIEAAA